MATKKNQKAAKFSKTFTAESEAELDRQIAEEGARAGRREYWASVNSFAQEALHEHPDDENAQEQHVWESVDGSSWVIYTAENYDVLRFTENDDAWSDEGAELDRENPILGIAFYALRADVMGQLERLRKAARAQADAQE